MLIVSHVAAGAAFTKVIPNAWVAALLAFLSHFILDMIPHVQAPTNEGYKPNKKTFIVVLLDLLLSFAFIYYFQPNKAASIVIFAAVLPDILDLTRYNAFFYKVFKPYYNLHDKIQNETWKPIGYISQFLLIVVCLLLIGASR